ETEDKPDPAAGKNIADDRAVRRIARAVAGTGKGGGDIDEPKRRRDSSRNHATDVQPGDEDGDAVRRTAAQPVGDRSPKYGRADADEADQSEVKRSGEFFIADRDKVGDHVGIDQE